MYVFVLYFVCTYVSALFCICLYVSVSVYIYMYVSACITRLNTVAINDFIASTPPPQQGSQWAKSWPTS